MKYTTSKQIGTNKKIYVDIRLDGECKNGHQDFAITGNIYDSLISKSDRYYESGGCIHDEILKHFPEFKIFIDLHLCDYKGAPMYAVENGFYHLANGFSNMQDDESFVQKFCEYYRLTEKQYYILQESENQLEYAVNLIELGILNQWQQQANEAIKILEGLTGETFVNTSTKENFHRPENEAVAQFKERKEKGYYSVEKKKERAEQKAQQEKAETIKKIKSDCDKTIEEARKERDVKLAIFEIGGNKALKNTIYYNHSNEIKVNWLNYEPQLSQDEVGKLIEGFRVKQIDVNFK